MSLLPQSTAPFHPVTWSLEYELVFYVLAVLIVPLFGVWGLAAVLFGLVQWALRSPPDFFTFHLVATLNADFLSWRFSYASRFPTFLHPSSF
jgi:peptidoglycan/LPS O-acetylase OafA/YrhL